MFLVVAHYFGSPRFPPPRIVAGSPPPGWWLETFLGSGIPILTLICRWHPGWVGGGCKLSLQLGFPLVLSVSKKKRPWHLFQPTKLKAPQQTHLDRIGASRQLMVSPWPWHQIRHPTGYHGVTQMCLGIIFTPWPESMLKPGGFKKNTSVTMDQGCFQRGLDWWSKYLVHFGSIYLVPSIFGSHPLGAIYLASASSIT